MHDMWCIFHSSNVCLLIFVFLEKVLSHLFRNHCMIAITLCLIVALSSTQHVSISGKSYWIKKRTVTQFRNSCTRIFLRSHPLSHTPVLVDIFFFENSSNKCFSKSLKSMYFLENSYYVSLWKIFITWHFFSKTLLWLNLSRKVNT